MTNGAPHTDERHGRSAAAIQKLGATEIESRNEHLIRRDGTPPAKAGSSASSGPRGQDVPLPSGLFRHHRAGSMHASLWHGWLA